MCQSRHIHEFSHSEEYKTKVNTLSHSRLLLTFLVEFPLHFQSPRVSFQFKMSNSGLILHSGFVIVRFRFIYLFYIQVFGGLNALFAAITFIVSFTSTVKIE